MKPLYLTLSWYTDNTEYRTLLTIIRNIAWMLVIYLCSNIVLYCTSLRLEDNFFTYTICKLFCVITICILNDNHLFTLFEIKMASWVINIYNIIFLRSQYLPIYIYAYKEKEENISAKTRRCAMILCIINLILFEIISLFVLPEIENFYIVLLFEFISTINLLCMQINFDISLIRHLSKK